MRSLDHVNKRPFAYLDRLDKVRDFRIAYLTYLMKVRDLKTATYKTINVSYKIQILDSHHGDLLCIIEQDNIIFYY